MARPKAYNREQVVDAATDVFWRKGYYAASLSDLVAATGLNKHSMYKEFGSKAGLFDVCLDNYTQKVTSQLVDILKREPLGLDNIRAFFEERISYICSSNFKGCLSVKSVVEGNLLEVSALNRLAKQDEMFRRAFSGCLTAAIDSGQLPENKDPALLTNYLLNNLFGMLISGSPANGRKEAEQTLDLVMASLQ